jgi:hypothetical protein
MTRILLGICAIDYPGNGQIPDPNPDTPGLIVDDVGYSEQQRIFILINS